MAQENLNPFEIAQKQFDIAADRLALADGLREILRTPKRQLTVAVPTLMDNGAVKVFQGTASSTTSRAGRPRAGSGITRK